MYSIEWCAVGGFWMLLSYCVNINNNKLLFGSGVKVTVSSRECSWSKPLWSDISVNIFHLVWVSHCHFNDWTGKCLDDSITLTDFNLVVKLSTTVSIWSYS